MLDDIRGLGREPMLLASFWDDLSRGDIQAEGSLDPTLTRAIREFQGISATESSSGPDPTFVSRLLNDLTTLVLDDQTRPAAEDRGRLASANGRENWRLKPHPARLPSSHPRRFPGPLATAAILLLSVVASLVAFGPLQLRLSHRDALVPSLSGLPAFGPVEFVAEVTSTPEHVLFDPSFVNVDPSGNMWITDDRYSRFLIFAPDGAFLETWGAAGDGEGEFSFSSGGHTYGDGDVAWDSAGNLYVVDTGHFRVQKFDANRQFLRTWGGKGTADGEFEEPLGIAISPDDRVYVTDAVRDEVQIFGPDGEFLSKFGGFGVGDGQFLGVFGGIAVAPDGRVLVADTEGHRLRRFDRDGGFIETWGAFGGGNGEFASPHSVTTDMAGRVYVTDNFNHRVQIFTADGQFLSSWGNKGTDVGQFVYPAGIAIDRLGSIYVADTGNQRVQRFRPLPPLWPGSVLTIEPAAP